MGYCRNCGTQLVEGAKYCQKCGCQVDSTNIGHTQRKQVFSGKLYKCPNCGEILKSFELNCPTCGYELRGTKASSAVKEFALKLEAIESRREYEKPRFLFSLAADQQRVSKTDEQKISLIKSFSIPNSKEDMLEFMILATSSINMRTYDSFNTDISKSDKEVNAAWFSKVQQVYEKAKRSYSADRVFTEIQILYDECNKGIKEHKKKGILKWGLLFGAIPLLFILMVIPLAISIPRLEAQEIARLDNIVCEVQEALDNCEYTHALRIADSIDYQRYDIEMERKWDIEREYWVEHVIAKASDDGIDLEYTPTPDIDNANDVPNTENYSGGFIEGFKEGAQPGLDAVQTGIDEFSKITNDETTSDSDAKE